MVEQSLIGFKLRAKSDVTRSMKETLDHILRGIWVLAIDDEQGSRELISTILQIYGANVIAASSVDEALAQLSDHRLRRLPDVIVSDIEMPEKDGYEFVSQLRQMDESKGGKIPAIALTGFNRASDRARALASGFQMHITKPVDPLRLVVAISNLTGRLLKGFNLY